MNEDEYKVESRKLKEIRNTWDPAASLGRSERVCSAEGARHCSFRHSFEGRLSRLWC